MIELKKYQCEHCNTVYDNETLAQTCEEKHIKYSELQIVRAVHEKCFPVESSEGKWPEFIMVGKNELKNKIMRYKFESEENISDGYFSMDNYYNPDKK